MTRCVQVDAFTEQAFGGNPAAVVLLSEAREATWMQNVAAEMNLSDTAFLHAGDGGFELRWFTPTVEIDLCGHATLASAHVLWSEGQLSPDATCRFFTRSGELRAALHDEWIELDFPATPAVEAPAPAGLAAALGGSPAWVGRTRFDVLVELTGDAEVRELQPDFSALESVDARGVIVTAASTSADFDFVSRYFAPASGIREDPVTGSAHCALAPFWAERLGRDRLVGFQASRRGGVVRAEARGERVLLAGRAVTVMAGELYC